MCVLKKSSNSSWFALPVKFHFTPSSDFTGALCTRVKVISRDINTVLTKDSNPDPHPPESAFTHKK